MRQLYVTLALSGETPGRLIRTIRLETARAKLAHRPVPGSQEITAVARRCGFTDRAQFSRIFRAEYGQTPRQWLSQRLPSGTGPEYEARNAAADE